VREPSRKYTNISSTALDYTGSTYNHSAVYTRSNLLSTAKCVHVHRYVRHSFDLLCSMPLRRNPITKECTGCKLFGRKFQFQFNQWFISFCSTGAGLYSEKQDTRCTYRRVFTRRLFRAVGNGHVLLWRRCAWNVRTMLLLWNVAASGRVRRLAGASSWMRTYRSRTFPSVIPNLLTVSLPVTVTSSLLTSVHHHHHHHHH